MPINVAHEPDPRLIAQAGYMSGIGKAYLRERDYYDKQNQEAYARYVDDYNRRKQLEQEQYNRSQDMFNRGLQLDEMGYERAYKERDYETGFDQQQFQNELSADAHARQWEQVDVQNRRYDVYEDRNREQAELRRQEMAAKYNAEYQFTDEQKQQQHRLQQQIQSVQTDPTLNEQERAYALQQLQSQFDAIQPQLVPKQVDLHQQMQSELVETPSGYMGKKSDGSWYVIDTKKAELTAEKEAAKLDIERQKLALQQASKEAEVAMNNGMSFDIGSRQREIYDSLRMGTGAAPQQREGQGFGGANDPMNAPGQMGQPGIADVDQGAMENQQARQNALMQANQMLDAAGDDPAALEQAIQAAQQALGG